VKTSSSLLLLLLEAPELDTELSTFTGPNADGKTPGALVLGVFLSGLASSVLRSRPGLAQTFISNT